MILSNINFRIPTSFIPNFQYLNFQSLKLDSKSSQVWLQIPKRLIQIPTSLIQNLQKIDPKSPQVWFQIPTSLIQNPYKFNLKSLETDSKSRKLDPNPHKFDSKSSKDWSKSLQIWFQIPWIKKISNPI